MATNNKPITTASVDLPVRNKDNPPKTIIVAIRLKIIISNYIT